MKKHTKIFIGLILLIAAAALSSKFYKNEKTLVFEDAYPFLDDLACVRINGKYGYINKSGEVVIQPAYDSSSFFLGGFSIQTKGKLKGCIDTNGNVVIPFEYEEIDFSNTPYFSVKKEGKYGCINTKGEIIIEPSFAFGSSFTQGVAPVIIDENTYETVYINANGEIVDFDEYGKSIAAMMSKYWPESASFYPSYYLNKDSNQRAMAIDREGKILFKTIYDDISMPEHNMALVNLNGKVGCINEKGIEILPPLYEDIQIAYENKLVIKENGKYGIIDIFRNEILPLKYDDIKSYDSKLALVKLNGRWSCLNLETNELKENVYDNVYSYLDIPFLGFPIPVQKNEVWFYIDENGEILF
ncbi:WG repeat-containing protein [Clostridium culturomicium]|uniref:WG repeat-containing protein n=1 Tax=Clostridium culturomicium TaxID=1499683 RepID=UPI00058BDD44|nr:WG repeat-containing protein [Clostridium culturomicium]